MINIILRYSILLILTLLVLSAFSFALIYLFPGDPLINLTGIIPQNEMQRNALVTEFRLDKAYLIQFFHYIGQLFSGNWGYSFISGRPLLNEIAIAMPATVELSVYALFISLLIGIPLGSYAGLRAYTVPDAAINSTSVIGYSLPVFWLALIFILVFSLQFGWLPLSGRMSLLFNIPNQTGFLFLDIYLAQDIDKTEAIKDALLHLILPTLSIATVTTAAMTRITRRSVIDVLNQQYIIAARSKGLSSAQIFFRHIIRNALLPILPLLAVQITSLITNAMIVETLFSWPGMGNWVIQAIYQRDYPALRIGMLAISTLIIVITIAIDFFNRVIDPSREKFERATI